MSRKVKSGGVLAILLMKTYESALSVGVYKWYLGIKWGVDEQNMILSELSTIEEIYETDTAKYAEAKAGPECIETR